MSQDLVRYAARGGMMIKHFVPAPIRPGLGELCNTTSSACAYPCLRLLADTCTWHADNPSILAYFKHGLFRYDEYVHN